MRERWQINGPWPWLTLVSSCKTLQAWTLKMATVCNQETECYSRNGLARISNLKCLHSLTWRVRGARTLGVYTTMTQIDFPWRHKITSGPMERAFTMLICSWSGRLISQESPGQTISWLRRLWHTRRRLELRTQFTIQKRLCTSRSQIRVCCPMVVLSTFGPTPTLGSIGSKIRNRSTKLHRLWERPGLIRSPRATQTKTEIRATICAELRLWSGLWQMAQPLSTMGM